MYWKTDIEMINNLSTTKRFLTSKNGKTSLSYKVRNGIIARLGADGYWYRVRFCDIQAWAYLPKYIKVEL